MTTKKATTYECPECHEVFRLPQVLGAHRLRKHGVLGKDASRKKKEIKPAPTAVLQCPHCDFVAATKSGFTHHLNKKHDDLSQHGRIPKGNQLAKLQKKTDRAAVTLEATNHAQPQDHPDAIPEALIAEKSQSNDR